MREVEIARAKDGRPILQRIDDRRIISKENKQTFAHEKRMKELSSRGYSTGQIKDMMYSKRHEFSAKEIERATRNNNIRTDGKL